MSLHSILIKTFKTKILSRTWSKDFSKNIEWSGHIKKRTIKAVQQLRAQLLKRLPNIIASEKVLSLNKVKFLS